ncbi:MAG: Holliday junction resolvase RuvX [Planctomycetota bacterium]
MRYLSIDLGDRRTGIAAGDDESCIVTPVAVVEVPRGDRLMNAIVDVINDHVPDELVVGLAMNMDGSEGDRAKICREFGLQLQQRTALPVRFQDERLTSFDANEQMAQSGLTHGQKKSLRDALAAAAILRDYFESLA